MLHWEVQWLQSTSWATRYFDAGVTVLNATYPRVPLLNQSLPVLPPKIANSSAGQLVKAAVDAASVSSVLLTV